MKNTFLFTYSTNILVHLVNIKNFLTPKIRKCMCDPILVTLLKLLPHYSKSSCENATPSSGTSLLASYKEVPPPPPTGILGSCQSAIGQFFPLSLVTVQEVLAKVISPQFSPHFLKWQVVSHPTEYVSALHLGELTTSGQGFWHFFVWHGIYYIIVHCVRVKCNTVVCVLKTCT